MIHPPVAAALFVLLAGTALCAQTPPLPDASKPASTATAGDPPPASPAAAPADKLKPIALRTGLAIGGVARSGRTLLRTDPIELAIVRGTFTPPVAGEKVATAGGEKTWAEIAAGDDGWFGGESLARGGYVFCTFESPANGAMILRALGHGMVYVNSEPRAGDPYSAGYVNLPIPVKKGTNTLLFAVARGRVKADLVPIEKDLFFDASDSTLPDVIDGSDDAPGPASWLVVNASPQWREFISRTSRLGNVNEVTKRWPIAPYSSLKPRSNAASGWLTDPSNSSFDAALMEQTAAGLQIERDKLTFELRRRKPTESQRRTFISAIDGSVQYYGFVPASESSQDPQAMILSLHGASVEGQSQAQAYSSHTWTSIVCPTNRRPFGFDWEDWGRLDALEALSAARYTFKPDPDRIYLTGHSMGGHGTWQLAVHHPDLFAAIAPSAGWCSFWTYAAGPRPEPKSAPGAMLRDAANQSDTAALITNLVGMPTYILHGDADDNVPVSEARAMRERLQKIGVEPLYHEQPGAGHWWDGDAAPGADCLEWPGIFELFKNSKRTPPESRDHIAFKTFNPANNGRQGWVHVFAAIKPFELSAVDVTFDKASGVLSGSTENVRILSLDRADFKSRKSIVVKLDGADFEAQCSDDFALERTDAGWRVLPEKRGDRFKFINTDGTLKGAFNNMFVMVCATGGTPEENAWALNKARYDSETWRVRGNGFGRIVTDEAYLRDEEFRNSASVILYGHSKMNKAWSQLISPEAVSVEPGKLTIAGRTFEGDDLACMITRPRSSPNLGCVAIIAGTGLTGMRLCDRMPIFVSGAGTPDVFVADSTFLSDGEKGLVAAGFWGWDWSVEAGRFAFKDTPFAPPAEEPKK